MSDPRTEFEPRPARNAPADAAPAATGTRPWRVWFALAGIFLVLVFYASDRFQRLLLEADLQWRSDNYPGASWLPAAVPRATQDALADLIAVWNVVDTARRETGLAWLIDGERRLTSALGAALRLDFFAPADGPGQLTVHTAPAGAEAVPANVYLIVGDSMVLSPLGSSLGESLVEAHGGRYFRHGVVATGLSRRDYFDWPAELHKLIAQHHPTMIVVLIGLNDIRAARGADGKLEAFGGEAFQETYRENIRALLRVAQVAGVPVYWLEVPMTEDPATNAKLSRVNALQREAAGAYPNVHYVATWDLLADDAGLPQPYLKLSSERRFHPWGTDGVHLTATAARYVVRSVLPAFDLAAHAPDEAAEAPAAPAAPEPTGAALRCYRYPSLVLGGEAETCVAGEAGVAPQGSPVLLLYPAAASRDVIAAQVQPWAHKLGLAVVLQAEPSAAGRDGVARPFPDRRGVAQQYLAEVRRAGARAGAVGTLEGLLVVAPDAPNGAGMTLLAREDFACASLLRLPPPGPHSGDPPPSLRPRPDAAAAPERPLRPARLMTAPESAALPLPAERSGAERMRRGEYTLLGYGAKSAWVEQIPRHLVWHRLCQRLRDPAWPGSPQAGAAALFESIGAALPDAVTALLARGVSPRAQDAQGVSALVHAVGARRTAIAGLLLEQGADANARNEEGWPALAVAVQRGDGPTARRLIDGGAKVDGRDRQGRTALMVAAWKGNRPMLDLLLAEQAAVNAADRDGESALIKAVKYNRLETAARLIELGARVDQPDRTGKTPLMRAAYYNRTDLVALLLERGAKLEARDRTGWTPLMEAARAGSLASSRLLLERGADPLARAHDRKTAMMLAAREGRAATVRALLEAKDDPNRRDSQGYVALHYAARYGYRGVVAALLEGGAAPDAPDPAGGTALLYAARQGDLDLAGLLLRAGADPGRRNPQGESPRSVAAAGKNPALARLLTGEAQQRPSGR